MRKFDPFDARAAIAAAELANKYETALRGVMRMLGPEIPSHVDYSDPMNRSGLIHEAREALRYVYDAGIQYERSKVKKRNGRITRNWA